MLSFGISAKSDPVIVTGIPSFPGRIDEASMLMLLIFGSGADRTVHLVVLAHLVHVTLGNMLLQSNGDSHPLVGSASLLNLLGEQEAMVVQMESLEMAANEHATHDVAPATEGHPASHPVLARSSLLNLLGAHVTEVQVDASEQAVQVASVTEMASGLLQ